MVSLIRGRLLCSIAVISFGIAVVNSQNDACNGGAFVTTSGEIIESPNYPSNYPNNEYCTWEIEAPVGRYVRLDFLIFSLVDSTRCRDDYVKVYDGPDSSYDRVLRACGDGEPDTITSTGSYLFVEFESDNTLRDVGFRASVSFTSGTGFGSVDMPNWAIGLIVAGVIAAIVVLVLVVTFT